MNRKISLRAICMAALLLGVATASADTVLTFQLDMTPAITNATFDAVTQIVAARGTFDGWGTPGFQLTNNPSAANSNLYTGVFNDTNDLNGGETVWQYVIATGSTINTYETTADYNNRAALLPATSGASYTLPYVYWEDKGPAITNAVTFQVDMSEQIFIGQWNPQSDQVEVRGNFNSWSGGATMTNNPAILATNGQGVVSSNVYQITLSIANATNAANDFKYVTQPGTGWDSPASSSQDNGGNRWFINSSNQTLPVVFFDDVAFVSYEVTNYVKFEADMSVQETLGTFTNGNPSSSIEIHGDFNGWGSGITMTNDPANPNTNIFVADIVYTDPPGLLVNYKYVLQPNTQWENVPANTPGTGGGNRQFDLRYTNASYVVGPDYFSFEGPSALDDTVYVTNCMVTFTVDMTNAVGTDGTVFEGSGYPVYINGLNGGANNSFWTWGVLSAPPQYEMTPIGDSELYTVTVPVNRGQNIDLVYKYSINGNDNEAGFADNHERYIRSQPNYTMPVDVFGSQGGTTSTEASFGDLAITRDGQHVSLSWLGRQHVHLRTATALGVPTIWTPQLATDGTNLIVAPGGMATTNYAIGASNLYYELVYP